LYEELSGKGLEILFVSTDAEDDKDKVPVVAKEKNIPFPVVYDNGFHEAYSINEYPTSFFIDPKGNIRRRHRGFDSIDSPKEIEVTFDLLKNEETGPDSVN
jgi:peroxiredoxin